ncbi:MAG: tripartite tricarboxylate transporter substrate binding protein [Betaproteobacteria bacterium]|nr:tripartite tricarboxylate transporter substrate binding protein [Betaproteobacteria bacterium]
MKFSTVIARITIAGVLVALAGSAAAQRAYPNKPLRIIIPYVPGGTANFLPRLFGPKLTESWGQNVIVDNRPGGNTVIGSEILVKSAPDGYTLLIASAGHLTTPLLISTPYDPIKDFAPVATLVNADYVLVINPSVPANNLLELIALAKSKPGQLNYASSSAGGPNHLAAELFNMLAEIKIEHIPYKGGGAALLDIIGGRVEMYFSPPANVVPHIKSGRLKAIAASGDTRLPALPQVPTFIEAGLPGYVVRNPYWIFAPAHTPAAIIDKLSAEIARILAMPDIKERLLSAGMVPFVSTPEQIAAQLKADLVKYAKIIKTANIKIDN